MNLQKRKGITSYKGYYKSKISNSIFHYDSMTELAMMIYYDNSNINWIKNTKLRIPYIFENKKRNYIPDFILSNVKIIEIKGSNDKPELPFKCDAAINYCQNNNMVFELISYDDVKKLIDWNIVKTYHFNDSKKLIF